MYGAIPTKLLLMALYTAGVQVKTENHNSKTRQYIKDTVTGQKDKNKTTESERTAE